MPLFRLDGVEGAIGLIPAATAKAAGGGRKGTSAGGGRPLTEHALHPDEAADEAVEVNVHVFVCVAHGNDVVELAVEVEACGGRP